MKCDICQTVKETKTKRIPNGWHRHKDQLWCKSCWTDAFVLRAVTFRVASPEGGWKEFREAVKEQWIASTQIANYVTTQCFVRDVRREGQDKMPAMPRVYLYPELRERWPEVSPQAISSMERDYQGKYRAKRYKVVWTAEESLPNYRYPEPMVCHNAVWKAYFDQDRPCISLPIGRARWVLRLAGGHRYRRQLRAFTLIANGEAVRGGAAIYRKRAGSRGDVKDRDSGGQRAMYDVMVKLVAWLPKQPVASRSGTLYVRTAQDCLLLAVNVKDERLWTYNADNLHRAVAEHRNHLQRWSEDQKAEQRPVADFQSRRERSVVKYRRRMNDTVKRVAASLVRYASRRKFAEIKYTDDEKSYVDRFPWHELRSRIETLCNEYSISFASTEVKDESPKPLADKK